MSALVSFEKSATSVKDVEGYLRRNGNLETLQAAGMLDVELGIMARGLSTRGYCEVDARKSACPIRWLSIEYPGNGIVGIRAVYAEKPSDFPVGGAKPVKSVYYDANRQRFNAETWSSSRGDTVYSLSHVTYSNARNTRASRWETTVSFKK